MEIDRSQKVAATLDARTLGSRMAFETVSAPVVAKNGSVGRWILGPAALALVSLSTLKSYLQERTAKYE